MNQMCNDCNRYFEASEMSYCTNCGGDLTELTGHLRHYDYECLSCGAAMDFFRPEAAVYADVICPSCDEVSDGKAAKRIRGAATVRYKTGSVKGRMNSRANW